MIIIGARYTLLEFLILVEVPGLRNVLLYARSMNQIDDGY